MTQIPPHRRGPLLCTLLFVVGAAFCLLLIALLRLDIHAYKQQLATQLERALGKPVRLGDAELSFHDGIALDFRNLRIGTDESFSLHVPQLSTILKPFELLRGEIVIEQVLLDYPSLKLALPLNLEASRRDLSRLGLKTLQIRKGSLTILQQQNGKPLRIENFNLVLHGLGSGLVSQLATTATLFQSKGSIGLNAFIELTRQTREQSWREGTLRGELHLDKMRRHLLGDYDIPELPAIFDIAVALQGVPARNVKLQAALQDSASRQSLMDLALDWQSAPTHDSFGHLKLGLAGIPLQGDLRLDYRPARTELSGRITLEHTDIQTLTAASPRHPLQKLAGEISALAVDFSGPLHATPDNPLSPLQHAELQLQRLAYAADNLKLSDGQVRIELDEGRLKLAGEGALNRFPFHFDGSVLRPDQPDPQIDLRCTAAIDLGILQSQLTSPFWQRQILNGVVPLQLDISGSVDNMALQLASDLSASQLTIGKLLGKNPDQPLRLQLDGHLSPERLVLSDLALQLEKHRLAARGELTRRQGQWAGALVFAHLDPGYLQPLSPLFRHFNIHGELEGRLELNRASGPVGRFDIKNGGTHLTQVIGDLSQIEGSVAIGRAGLDIGPLKARLGTSAVTIDGQLTNWHSPLLGLHLQGAKVRASDLVFTNDKMFLRDLDGRIMINAGGILFDRVALTIEDRTHALVQGQLRDFRNPQTYLEVEADQAEILDIIDLFSGPPAPPLPEIPGFAPKLQIEARLAEGTIRGQAFRNAVGTIKDSAGIFTLEPLRLEVESGTALARVEFDRNRERLLKLSGRVANADLAPLYKHFFDDNGILEGKLFADFYLEGEAGAERFWRSANGGGHLLVRDGVLKKLSGLAKIFSLLNVSQLFKFKLPDINHEGLPFSELSLSPRFEKGIFHWQDLQIESPAINMSAVGRLNVLDESVDMTVGVKPLRTVDILLEKIPLIGWILTGKEKALITALFSVKGPLDKVEVSAQPVSSLSDTVLGIIGRTLTLPGKLIKDVDRLLTTPPPPGQSPPLPPPTSDK